MDIVLLAPPKKKTAAPPPGPTLPQVASATLSLDLRASIAAISSLVDGTPIPATWADQSGLGNDFTRGAGSSGLTKQSSGGIPYVQFNGVDDWLLGPNFFNNLDSFTIFTVWARDVSVSFMRISKIVDQYTDPGWMVLTNEVTIETDGSNYLDVYNAPASPDEFTKAVRTFEMVSRSEAHVYVNGDKTGEDTSGNSGTLASYSTTQPVRIGKTGGASAFGGGKLWTAMFYAPAPNATDRAAIETWLATDP